jgi:putative heme-binding domain-containing protein
MSRLLPALLFLATLACCAPAVADEPLGIVTPPGFEVSLYADDSLAHNIFSMTIDSHGRVVVAGPEFVKILHDTNGDGRADRATLFSPVPKSGAHGMYFDGPHLVCNGDDTIGRLRDADGDDVADGPMEIWTGLRHPEHGANGIVLGPDGWYYLICGNDAGVSQQHVRLPYSPVKEPRCGAVVRISRDGSTCDVLAHGFRNPYDLDFAPGGQLFTVDADGERDHHLPWYAPTRLFDIAPGQEHGWLLQGWQRSWNRPQAFFDNVERAAEIGRGSPTGLKVYRHRQFPARYWGGVFTACWTLGRVYFCPLEPHGVTVRSQPEVFLQTTGDVGFAPVDLAVGTEGDLFVAIGGRGTRGSVFRVRYVKAEMVRTEIDLLKRVLTADEPLSSWSRARWTPIALELGQEAFWGAVLDESSPSPLRQRAVEVLVELFGGVPQGVAARAIETGDTGLRARIAWALARGEPRGAEIELLSKLTRDPDPFVQRAAWDSLVGRHGLESAELAWFTAAESPHRRVRSAMLLVAVAQESPPAIPADAGDPRRLGSMLRLVDLRGAVPPIDLCLQLYDHALDAELRLEAVRLLQKALGDMRVQPGQLEVYSGYSANALDRVDGASREKIVARLGPAFPSGEADVDRELARLLAMLSADSPGLLEAIASRWTDESDPRDDVHYLIVASRLPGERTPAVTRQTAHILTLLHGKLAARHWYPSRNWPLRVGEAFQELCRRDPHLAGALTAHERFGIPDHSLFAALLPEDQRGPAARKLLEAALASDELESWTSELVSVVSVLPEDVILPVLRERWTDPGLRDAILPVLARRPQPDDRARFLEALQSAQPDIVRQAARALCELPRPASGESAGRELGAVVRSLRLACLGPEQREVRQALADLLAEWTGEDIAIDEGDWQDLGLAYAPWLRWFENRYPQEAAKWVSATGADAAAWRARLNQIDWSLGDAGRGKAVYEQKACHRCHSGNQRLGPDLTGAARRFSVQDLFIAILDPHKEVAPLYRTMLITTKSGRVYHGLLVYESPDGSLLQTSPDVTVRITGEELEAIRSSPLSLMPTGLLNDLSDAELADLYAHLKSLGSP